MTTREEFMRPRYPLNGVSIDDVAAALAVVAASPDIGQARILQIEAVRDDHLLVRTGFLAGIRAGGGRCVLLRRTETSWTVVEVSRWKS